MKFDLCHFAHLVKGAFSLFGQNVFFVRANVHFGKSHFGCLVKQAILYQKKDCKLIVFIFEQKVHNNFFGYNFPKLVAKSHALILNFSILIQNIAQDKSERTTRGIGRMVSGSAS